MWQPRSWVSSKECFSWLPIIFQSREHALIRLKKWLKEQPGNFYVAQIVESVQEGDCPWNAKNVRKPKAKT